MRLTTRDFRLLRDIALSHVLSRDQILQLDYFGSITRANTRLRELSKAGFIRRLDTPFFTQGLYMVEPNAGEVLGGRIAPIVAGRPGSPRFLQHALSVTNVRIRLMSQGAVSWRFEQQLRATFAYSARSYEVRPDGLAVFGERLTAVEVDLGHVAPLKFAEKLNAYQAFVASRECKRQWLEPGFELLIVTTGPLRAARLSRLAPKPCSFGLKVIDKEEAGVAFPGAWS